MTFKQAIGQFPAPLKKAIETNITTYPLDFRMDYRVLTDVDPLFIATQTFDWGRTQEGYYYWADIAAQVKQMLSGEVTKIEPRMWLDNTLNDLINAQ